GAGTSCAAELKASGQIAAAANFTALVSFSLKNKAGVAIPIHFSASGTACSNADVPCTLVGPAFTDPTFTECAAQWSTPQLVSTITTANGDASDPTLTSDQLTLYFVSGGKVYTAHRTATNAPWPAPTAVVFNGLATDVTIKLPKVSADGTRMFLEIIDSTVTLDQLFFATQHTGPTDWNAPVPVIGSATTQTLTDATFGPGGTVILGGKDAIGGQRDLYEGKFDETTGLSNVIKLALDTPADEDAPSVSADGLQLYFESNRDGSILPYVASRRVFSESFTTATRLDELDGDTALDGSPWVSNGARTIYFTSDRAGGTPRIWTATRTTF
ncbi:MAG: hypothetical protein ABI678_28990, partial [Kofleriaceae bacterium]